VSSLTRRVPDQGDIASHDKHTDKVGDIGVSATGCTYRLHSILLHTGTASGGHYKAYVLDSGTGRWLECNGASVCELSTREEASLFLQASTVLAEPDSSDDARAFEGNGKNSVSRSRSRESIKKIVTLRDDILRENAYMFLYQKVSNDIVISSLCNNDIASGKYSREEKDAVNKLLDKCISAVPTSLAKRILEENADLQELRRLNDIHKKIVALKILYKHPTREFTCQMTRKCSKFMGNARDEFKVVHQLALSSQTLNEVIRTVCPQLSLPLPSSSSSSSQASAISQEGQDKKVFKGNDNSNSIKCTDTLYYRLREFSEISWRKGATYGSRGDESLSSLGFSLLNTGISSHSPVVLLLETRTADDPPFEEELDQVMLLRALVWTEELTVAMETSLDFLETLSCLFPLNSDSSGSVIDVNTDQTTAAIRDTMMEILVPGELTATLGALRDAVATHLKKSASEIILLLVNQAGALLMEPDQDHRSLGKAYGIKPGDLIFIEIGPSFSPPPSPSSTAPDSPSIDFLMPCVTESVALVALDRRLTSIVIYFNDPRNQAPAAAGVSQTGATLPDQTPSDSKTPCKDENFLRVSPHTPLRDFKMLICDKLNIDLKVEDFYMSRNDLPSPSPSPSQLKDVTLTLHEAGLRTQGSVFLQASHMYVSMYVRQYVWMTACMYDSMHVCIYFIAFLFFCYLCVLATMISALCAAYSTRDDRIISTGSAFYALYLHVHM
jgi:Ubiquitin carboxyl-terminal hydrolase